jgi:SAM-dependent methyltransferase
MSAAAPPPTLELFARVVVDRTPCHARFGDGTRTALPLARWRGAATAEEREALDWAVGPVFDVGCGPGRLVCELERRGIAALGIDLSPAAVRLARHRGATAMCAEVWAPLPDAAWATALLFDGNIGIGGGPARSLRRLRQILRPPCRVLVELDVPSGG